MAISTRRSLGTVTRALGLSGLASLVAAALVIGRADLVNAGITVCFATVGLVLVGRRPRERIGWLVVLTAISFPLTGATLPGSGSEIVAGQASLRITTQAWLNTVGGPASYWFFIALAAIYPTGRFPAGHLGRIARGAVALPLLFVAALAVDPVLGVSFADGSNGQVANPIGLASGWTGWGVIENGAYVADLGALAIAIASLLIRFRRTRGAEREQHKWLLAAFGGVLSAVIFAFTALLLVDREGNWMWLPAIFAFPLIPIAIGIAITRHGLYEIDRIVSRTIGWSISTAAILATFALLVIGLQAVLAPLTHESTLAVAASTVAAFALLQPLHRRVQALVDHRFNRARFDAERISVLMAGRLRDEMDFDEIRREVLETLDASLQPVSARLWVRGE